MDLMQTLLNERKGELMEPLVEEAGFTSGQARSFLSPALGMIGEVLRSGGGGLDLGVLLEKGDFSGLLGSIDTISVAQQAGVPEPQARSGLQTLLPRVLGLLQERAGGAEGILALLEGGGSGALGRIAGKLFGR